MDAKLNVGCLTKAIPTDQIDQFLSQILEPLKSELVEMLEQFAAHEPTPAGTLQAENALADRLRTIGREIVAWLFSQIEPPVEQMPGTIVHRGESHRRLADKAPRTDVVTRFGKISLIRARYRRGRSGKTVFPLEILLGIEDGVTPAAATRIGKAFAATGSTQGRTLEMIEDQMGKRIGTGKLRRLIATLAGSMEPLRQDAQVGKLMKLIEQARAKEGDPVLSVSRDGVALGLAPWSFFEMAAVACVSVIAGGKKLGTVYLGRVPETNQATLSNQLTDLLRATVRRCGSALPRIVYVSDAGKVETAYWKNTLRKFFVDGRRIKITRVVDYYHAAERLGTIAGALKLDKTRRQEWVEHVRGLLLQPGGHGRVLRSIAKMRELHGYKKSEAADAQTAEKYLRRYRRFMDYASMREQGYPIGSGVVESACKQIVSERMKLSGMRWHKPGGQHTMTLRCLLLSGIWDTVYKHWLASKPTVSDLLPSQTAA